MHETRNPLAAWLTDPVPEIDPGPGSGLADGLAHVRAGADLAIFIACADVAWLLLGLALGRAPARRTGAGAGRAPRLQTPRLLALLALAVFVGGAAHVAPAPPIPARFGPTAVRVLAALLWVVFAARLPSLTASLTDPTPVAPTPRPGEGKGGGGVEGLDRAPRAGHDGGAGACPRGCAVGRLLARARALEHGLLHDPWLLDRSHALRELHDILADLEAIPCKT